MRHVTLLLALGSTLFGQIAFQPAVQYPSGNQPITTKAADLDGDGLPELLVDNDNTLSVLPNLGGGVFGLRSVFSTGGSTVTFTTADFNGDGNTDVVVVGYQWMVLLLGNGDRTFAPPTSIFVPGYSNFVAAGDLDGDGDADLALTDVSLYRLFVLLNDGSGSFSAQPPVSFQTDLYGVCLPDLDQDGDLDIAVVKRANGAGGHVQTYLNAGNATFTAGQLLVTSTDPEVAPHGIAAGHLNGDGYPDLVVALDTSNNPPPGTTGGAGVFMNTGSGSLMPVVPYAAGMNTFSVAVADLNGDGADEVAVPDLEFDHVYVLPNDGAGGLNAPVLLAVGQKPYGIDAADLDGDGLLDLATANNDSDDLSVLLNVSPGPPPAFPYPGTMEDLRLLSGVSGAGPTTGPSNFIKTAGTNDSITLVLESPGGGFSGAVFGIGVQLFPTGNPPIVSAPGIQIPSPITLIYSGAGPVVFGLPATGITLPLTVPPGLVGMSGLFQGAVFTPNAANGVFATTHGHEIQVTQ